MKKYVPADIIVYKMGEGIVLREKSLIAYHRDTKKVVAVGDEAEGKDESLTNVECMSPFHFGKIEEFNCALSFMKGIFSKAFGMMVRKPALVVCLSEHFGEVPMKAYEDLFLCAGAREVRFHVGTIQDFLVGATEKEKKHYKGIVEITKENKLEYAKELLEETYAHMQEWGITKEVMLEMIKVL